jgi:hypothetical protein
MTAATGAALLHGDGATAGVPLWVIVLALALAAGTAAALYVLVGLVAPDRGGEDRPLG